MTYDLLGRMLTRVDGSGGGNPETTSWTYDLQEDSAIAKGKVTEVTMPGYTAKYFYDNLQRDKRTRETIDGVTYTMSTDYDQGSRVATVKYPSDFTIRNAYNAHGHLVTVTDDGTGTFLWRAFADDERGNITELRLGNQVESLRAFDPQRGWLESILSTKVSNGAVLQDLTYDFNKLGNLSKRSDRPLSSTPLTEIGEYDNLNRLTKSTVTQGGSGGGSTITTVGYDVLGDITSKSDVGGTYSYGQLEVGCTVNPGKHAVTRITGKNATYCYDQNGNMTSGDGRTIAYTPYDLPSTITRGTSTTVTFAYGPERQRIKRVDSTSAGTTTTIYAGGKSYEVITRPGGVEKKALYRRLRGHHPHRHQHLDHQLHPHRPSGLGRHHYQCQWPDRPEGELRCLGQKAGSELAGNAEQSCPLRYLHHHPRLHRP
jgi:hypothetical protein